MKCLLLTLLFLFSLPVLTPEPKEEGDMSVGIGEDVKAPKELPMKLKRVPYDSTWTEHDCLAHNIYFEGRSEGELGMKLIAQVTLNRVRSDKKYHKNSICEVVKTKNAFSWYSDGKSDIPQDTKSWALAKKIATRAMKGDYKNLTNSLYFKVCSVDSSFFDKLRFKHRYKRHCFYTYEE
jgi:spore germination cell wall hydrolase CwlJ-like protein